MGWLFTPLDKIDGENEVIDSLYALRESPLCWRAIDVEPLDSNNERLIEGLEDLYRRAMQPWEQFRTVFDCSASQREFSRWPNGTYSARIRKKALMKYWELVTTSRFSVNEIPNIYPLQEVGFTDPPMTLRHDASLAMMACIIYALEHLQHVLSSWKCESRRLLQGKPFEWAVTNNPQGLESIVLQILRAPNGRRFYAEQVREAWDCSRQAELWLSQINTLDFHETEIKKIVRDDDSQTSAKVTKEIAKRATTAARNPRGKAKALSPQMVSDHFNANRGVKLEPLVDELAKRYSISPRTVKRRMKEARDKKLMP